MGNIEPSAVTFKPLGVTFKPLAVTFEPLGVTFELLAVPFEPLGVTFHFLFSWVGHFLALSTSSQVEKKTMYERRTAVFINSGRGIRCFWILKKLA